MELVPGKKDKVWNTDGAAIDAARACYDEIGRFLTGGALVSEITQAMLATIA